MILHNSAKDFQRHVRYSLSRWPILQMKKFLISYLSSFHIWILLCVLDDYFSLGSRERTACIDIAPKELKKFVGFPVREADFGIRDKGSVTSTMIEEGMLARKMICELKGE
jgi:hypothetical protein